MFCLPLLRAGVEKEGGENKLGSYKQVQVIWRLLEQAPFQDFSDMKICADSHI